MKIMIAWELGNGFGHIARLLPIAKGLSERGHEIVWVVPDSLTASSKLPGGSVIENTPSFGIPDWKIFFQTITLTHILYNIGYQNPERLDRVVKEWHVIMDKHLPDIILFDYSPSVLIANLSKGIAMFHIGDGFTVPPQTRPFGLYLPNNVRITEAQSKTLCEAEDRLVNTINNVMSKYAIRPIESLAQLYGTAKNAALLSYPELDHFTNRVAGYYGVMTNDGNDELIKYEDKKHILLYLKDFQGIEDFQDRILKCRHALSVYISQPELPKKFMKKLMKRKDTKIYYGPVNFKRAGEVCDLMISHGNHTTTAQALKEGIPVLAIPVDNEKGMVSQRIKDMGAGDICPRNSSDSFPSMVERIIHNDYYKFNALKFKNKYSEFDAEDSMEKLIDRIELVMMTLNKGLITV